MSALERSLLSRAEARSLTDEVKHDVARVELKLLELYDGTAWKALDYDSWRDYWISEFGERSLSMSYKQIAAGRAMRTIESGRVEHVPQPNQRQAIALAPLAEQPEVQREVWAEVIEAHPEPTAKQVREVVQRHTAPKKPAATPRVVVALKELYAAVQATPIEEVTAWEGNARKLAGEWASVQSYITDVFAAGGVAVPKVLKGVVDG